MTRFPLTAIVGQDDLVSALLLCAVDPALGGVLVRGERGTAKTTAVRALAALLPEQEVASGCAYGVAPGEPCPCDGEHVGVEVREAPMVELPLGATIERVVGALDVRRALQEGAAVFEPGLLAAAHRGVLYADEVNLLPDAAVDVLLDVAASGVNVVERDGHGVRHPARFLLVGTMNPEEGELRPQLLDRFGLGVEVHAPADAALRTEVVRRRLRFDADPAAFVAGFATDETALAMRLIAARDRLGAVRLPDRQLIRITALCARLGVDGLRADLATTRAALALAALDGIDEVQDHHVERAATLALTHRLRRDPLAPPPSPQTVKDALDDEPDPEPPTNDGAPSEGSPRESDAAPRTDAARASADATARAAREGDADRSSANGRASADRDRFDDRDGAGSADRFADRGRSADRFADRGRSADRFADRGRSADRDGAGSADRFADRGRFANRDSAASAGGDRSADDLASAGRDRSGDGRVSASDRPGDVAPDVANALAPVLDLGRRRRTGGAAGRRARSQGTGTVVGARHGDDDIAIVPTLLAARRAPVRPHHLRSHLREGRQGVLLVLCVDASGSMGARKRMALVKGTILKMLGDAYQRRDRVALVTFRGATAQLPLPPTGAVDHAAAALRTLPTGGRTPIAAGLALAADVVRRERLREPDRAAVVVLVSDGRANAGADPVRTAARLSKNDIQLVVVDGEQGPVRLGGARRIALAAGGATLTLDPRADGHALATRLRALAA